MTAETIVRGIEAVLEHGNDDTMRSLANAIIREQRREIADIDAWLAAR